MSEFSKNERAQAEEGDDLDTVLGRLTQTIEWCLPRVVKSGPRGCLRSVELWPNILERSRRRIVGSVASARHIWLGCKTPRPATDLGGGRLLLYEPEINLFHGLEEAQTYGYVDKNNIPPWDTWIAYIVEDQRGFLLSWVPEAFLSLMQEGIDVNPEECLFWLESSQTVLARTLRERGLL